MSNGKQGNEFLRQLVSLILDETKIVGSGAHVRKNHDELVDFKQPKDLEAEIKLIFLNEKLDDQQLLDVCRKVIKYSVKTSHPYFFNQLYAGIDQYSLAGAWLSDALNTSQATYEIAPVFTIMERQAIKYLGGLCGWSSDDIDGIFAPGGSMSNIYGLVCARHAKFPQVKSVGLRAVSGQLVSFVSEGAHYSFSKGSVWLGQGLEGVIKVKTDEAGRMDPVALDVQIQAALDEGKIPFMVGATAGTTVLGAFDPLDQVADVCTKYGLWLHVDAALGGTVLFSRRHRTLMAGIERADSMAWNLHKLGGIPLQCSLFATRHATILKEANSLHAEYLFQSDKYYDADYDTGDKSIQCGRKVDSLKLCLALLARGEAVLEQQMDNVFEMSKYVTEKLRETQGIKLVLPQFELSNICFWYLPESLRDGEPDKERLHKVCPAIKSLMMKESKIMVNYQPLTSKSLPNFFRLVLTCVPPPTKDDMDAFVSEIVRLGDQVEV